MDYNRQSLNIYDTKKGDVNGDGVIDTIYIIGRQDNTLVINDIHIMIRDGKTSNVYNIFPKYNKGYEPHLFLGDFNSDSINDIMVSIESGNTGLESYNYIYSFINNRNKLLFNFEDFNNTYRYDVTYLDNYIVKVKSMFDNFEYSINISDKDYISQIYDTDGHLKKSLKGYVSPVIDVKPILDNNSYNIEVTQRIIGYYNADILGKIITILKWNGNQFRIISKSFID